MKIGVVGLGKMGEAIAYRLLKGGHEVVVFDPNASAARRAKRFGVQTVKDLVDIAKNVRVIWIMVPAGKVVDDVLKKLRPYLKSGDIIIDGGNSNFKDTIRRSKALSKNKIHFLDCGTSGGLYGRKIGFSLMVGGDEKAFTKVKPIFKAIAAPNGFGYIGPSGSGHYVKMVHNGIEYALLQSYAEGFKLLKYGKYKNLDLEKISKVWMNGSVIRSWILDLIYNIFKKDQKFKNVSGEIGENLTGYWTVQEAKEQKIPVDLIKQSLDIRAWSRKTGGDYATKLVSLMRNQFGGHPVKMIKEEKKK